MNCTEVQDRVEDLVHGFMPASEEHSLRAHLLNCGSCAQRYQWVEKIALEVAGKATRHPVPDELRRAIEKDLSRAGSTRSWRHPAFWVPAAALAVAVLALAVLFRRPEQKSLPVARVIQDVVGDYQSQWLDPRRGEPELARADLQRWLEKAIDLKEELPFKGNDEFLLLGARSVKISGRQAALLVYRRGQATIGLFMIPAKGIDFPVQPDGRRRVLEDRGGYTSLTWSWASYICSLVSTQENRQQVVALWEKMRSRPASG